MSWFTRLLVVGPNEAITEPSRYTSDSPYLASTVLTHHGDFKSFASNFFPVYDGELEDLAVTTHALPEGFHIADFTGEEKFIHNSNGVPFYYVLAGELAKLEFEADEVDPRDRGMMAYLAALPPSWRIIPYVIF